MTEKLLQANNLLSRHTTCRHGFFTRVDSCQPQKALGALDSRIERIATLHQTHSSHVVLLSPDKAWEDLSSPPLVFEGDGLITATNRVALGIYTADCMPILLLEPEAHLSAALHVGWKGAFGGIIEVCLSRIEDLGGRRECVIAAIGPAIAQASYPVGEEFSARFLTRDPENSRFFRTIEGRTHFDLVAYGCARLREGGVLSVEALQCDTGRELAFASRRRLGAEDRGRNLSCIALL